MVDIDAAIGYVVAHGDQVDRARLSWLRSGAAPHPDVLAKVEMGQTADGGWPAFWGGDVGSVDATCFRLGELDDLGALDRPPARRALAWLRARQRPDGTWEEDEALAGLAPEWARPGDPEARLYLTANAGYWLAMAGPDDVGGESGAAEGGGPAGGADMVPGPVGDGIPVIAGAVPGPVPGTLPAAGVMTGAEPAPARDPVTRAAEAFKSAMGTDGTWPSYLAAGWLGAGLLYHLEWFYESAQIQVLLTERIPDMSPGDGAWLAAALRRAGLSEQDWVLAAARRRLSATQRSDGGWPSDDGGAFDVHTTLAAIRALR